MLRTLSVSTRRSISRPEETASTLRVTFTKTVADFEDFDSFPQRAADSGSQHSAASTVPALLNLGSLTSASKLVQGNECVANVEESMCRGKRDRNLNSVQTLSDSIYRILSDPKKWSKCIGKRSVIRECGEPASPHLLVFCLLAPSARGHLTLLSRRLPLPASPCPNAMTMVGILRPMKTASIWAPTPVVNG